LIRYPVVGLLRPVVGRFGLEFLPSFSGFPGLDPFGPPNSGFGALDLKSIRVIRKIVKNNCLVKTASSKVFDH
jgi:hypothetical protein